MLKSIMINTPSFHFRHPPSSPINFSSVVESSVNEREREREVTNVEQQMGSVIKRTFFFFFFAFQELLANTVILTIFIQSYLQVDIILEEPLNNISSANYFV